MTQVIGTAVSRVDGPAKVTGNALDVTDLRPEGLLCAAIIGSKFANGRVLGIDREEALTFPGMVETLSTANMPRPAGEFAHGRSGPAPAGRRRFLLEASPSRLLS
jgi:CO/xanthine dehydrogenase Mo-binding subunit